MLRMYGTVLFGLIATLGGVSGGHFNPAITFAAALLRRIDPIDAVVYILAHFDDEYCGLPLIDEARAAGQDQLFLYVADYRDPGVRRPGPADRRGGA